MIWYVMPWIGVPHVPVLMPDGSLRPRPAWMDKPQGTWTEEESKQCAAFQQEHIEMTKRLSNQETTARG